MASTARQAGDNKSNLGKRDDNLVSTGLKASRFTDKKGINVNLDRYNVDARQKQEMAGFGEGKVRIAYVDKQGNIIKDSYYESGNIMFNPRANGTFAMTDKNLLLYQQKISEELEDYIDSIIDFCTTDTVEKFLFDLEDNEYNAIFGSIQKGDGAHFGMSDELAAVDCRPSYMRSLLPQSQQFAQSAQKKRKLIEHFRPIIQDSSETKTGADKGESGAYEKAKDIDPRVRDPQVKPIVV